MVFLTKVMSIYSEVNPPKFLPVTDSKIKIDECTLLGSSRTHVGATNLVPRAFSATKEDPSLLPAILKSREGPGDEVEAQQQILVKLYTTFTVHYVNKPL